MMKEHSKVNTYLLFTLVKEFFTSLSKLVEKYVMILDEDYMLSAEDLLDFSKANKKDRLELEKVYIQ